MPQIQNPASSAPQPYGSQPNNNTKTFQERLMERFKGHEYVTVMNVDTEPYQWQYMPEHAEEVEFTADPMKITHRGQPEMWVINPGEKETIVGANAYVMMDGLYKRMVAKKKLQGAAPEDERQAINFSFSDGEQMEYWINKILVGKTAPTFGVSASSKDLGRSDVTSNTAKDLVANATAEKA